MAEPDQATQQDSAWYSAKDGYQDYSVAVEYEGRRFSGVLGRYRWYREQQAIKELLMQFPSGVSVLDCPCGTGRWWDLLSQRATRIVAADISEGMLKYARERSKSSEYPVEFHVADAEALPFQDGAVDFTFSHALTKHLPWPVQAKVLKEFARVSRRGVVCSFGIFGHLTYEFWRRRRLVESYPMLPEELSWMAANAGLEIDRHKKCTTPVGVEHAVLFRKM